MHYAYRQNLIVGFEDLFKVQGTFMLYVLTLELADSSILPEVPEQLHHISIEPRNRCLKKRL